MPGELKRITWDEVKKHTSSKNLWMVYNGKVYDVTSFLEQHPGGEEVLLEQAGADATQPFDEIGHSPDAIELLEKMVIGELDAQSEKPKSIVKDKAPEAAPAKEPSSLQDSTPMIILAAYPLAIIAGIIYAKYFY